MVDAGTYLTITDTRPCAVGNQFTLEGLAYQVYLACNQALTPKALTQALGLPDYSWQKIEPVVAELCERKLLLSLNGRLLSLAIKEPCQPFLKEHPGGEVNVLEYIKLRRFMSKVTALT